jgi:hypothetical protein
LSAIGSFLLRFRRKNTLHLLIVKRNATTVFSSKDKSKRPPSPSLHYDLNAPTTASQASVPGVARERARGRIVLRGMAKDRSVPAI